MWGPSSPPQAQPDRHPTCQGIEDVLKFTENRTPGVMLLEPGREDAVPVRTAGRVGGPGSSLSSLCVCAGIGRVQFWKRFSAFEPPG